MTANGRSNSSRWVGVGQSNADSAEAAGSDAIKKALTGADPKLVVVFCSDKYDLSELLDGIRASSKETPLIGCSTAGEIATNGPGEAGVVVTVLGGDGFSVATRSVTGISKRLREAGAEAAEAMSLLEGDARREHKTLMLLTDGLAGDQQEIVRGAYSVLGASVPLVGGCAGDDMKMQATRQFHNGDVFDDAIVAAAVRSDAPIGIGVRHGWARVGDPVLVTASAENRVFELDDRPALDVYLEHLNPPAEASKNPEAFTQFALTHPLGLMGRGDEEHVRFIGGANFDDRSLEFIAEVPQGSSVWFMRGDSDSVLNATDSACSDAVEALGGEKPTGVLAFDCVARKGVLGNQGIEDEIKRIDHHCEGVPIAGFYTYGEIARVHGISGFHNQTLVVMAIG